MYGLDHAQTLAVLVPAMLKIRMQGKRQKLLQYARRIWNINTGSEESRINEAIYKTRRFFESMGLPTCLSGYGIKSLDVELIISQLIAHGMTNLGENRDVTPEVMRGNTEALLIDGLMEEMPNRYGDFFSRVC